MREYHIHLLVLMLHVCFFPLSFTALFALNVVLLISLTVVHHSIGIHLFSELCLATLIILKPL